MYILENMFSWLFQGTLKNHLTTMQIAGTLGPLSWKLIKAIQKEVYHHKLTLQYVKLKLVETQY